MPRVAFRLRTNPNAIEGYERDHKNVWPELLARLKEVDYSIFRREQDLVLVMHLKDFDAASDAWPIPSTCAGRRRWPSISSPYPGLQPGERFAMMKEVFYVE